MSGNFLPKNCQFFTVNENDNANEYTIIES
jgi:hypothetical protein